MRQSDLLDISEAYADCYSLYIVERPALYKYAPDIYDYMSNVDGNSTSSPSYIWEEIKNTNGISNWKYNGSNITEKEGNRNYYSNDIIYSLDSNNIVTDIILTAKAKTELYESKISSREQG